MMLLDSIKFPNPDFLGELMVNLVVSAIAAVWIAVIALLSVQNASLVSLSFIFWRSIELPWGIILAGAVAIGFLIGGCLPLIAAKSTSVKRRERSL
jgi:uncharacterized integral membrane protein